VTPVKRDVLRITGEAAIRLSEALYRLGWAVHHRAGQIETWGLAVQAKAGELRYRTGAE
jgi:hypothetical protein